MPATESRPYRSLDPAAIVSTIEALSQRIHAGFPGSGLAAVSRELVADAREIQQLAGWLARPIPWARYAVGFGLALLVAGLAGAVLKLRVSMEVPGIPDLLQGIDAGVNDVVFIGIAVYFLLTIETRVKRSRALRSLHTLRSLAHIIDMHQLKKDPEQVGGGPATAGASVQAMPADTLALYLDHCGDMLALISKLAALHAQEFNDDATLRVVQEVEDLAHDLLRIIWQKIAVADRLQRP